MRNVRANERSSHKLAKGLWSISMRLLRTMMLIARGTIDRDGGCFRAQSEGSRFGASLEQQCKLQVVQ